jgi:hypothetical protein
MSKKGISISAGSISRTFSNAIMINKTPIAFSVFPNTNVLGIRISIAHNMVKTAKAFMTPWLKFSLLIRSISGPVSPGLTLKSCQPCLIPYRQ